MAREKRWTNKQVFILVIVVLIAVAVALIVPTVVKNYYQNNANLKGELAETPPQPPYGCASGDHACQRQGCYKKVRIINENCVGTPGGTCDVACSKATGDYSNCYNDCVGKCNQDARDGWAQCDRMYPV